MPDFENDQFQLDNSSVYELMQQSMKMQEQLSDNSYPAYDGPKRHMMEYQNQEMILASGGEREDTESSQNSSYNHQRSVS